MSLRFFNFIR